MTATKTTDITPAADGAIDVSAVLDIIRAGGKIHLLETEQDNEQIAREILERTLGATSVEELESEPIDVANFLNQRFELRGVTFRNSDYEGGIGIYAILSGVSEHGEFVTISAGSDNIVIKAIKYLEFAALPRWVKLTSDKTKAGFDVYNMAPAGPPAKAVAKSDGF
jgi:hypothetical protein